MFKQLARIVAFLCLSFLLMVGGIGLWLKQDVHALDWAKPKLEAALNLPGAPYKITFGNATIDWRHFSRLGRLKVKQMTVTLLDGTVFASIPAVEITIDPLGFLPHHNAFNTIIINSPRLYLSRTAEGGIRMGLDNVGQSLPLNDLIGFFAGGNEENSKTASTFALPFRAIAIENATLTMMDQESNISLTSNALTLRLAKQSYRGIHGYVSMPFTYNNRPGRVNAMLSTPFASRQRMLDISAQQFPIELACQFGACPQDISGTGLITGGARLIFDRHYHLQAGSTSLTSQATTLTAPKFFPETLKSSEGVLAAHVSNDAHNIVVDRWRFAFEDTTLSGQGQIIIGNDNHWRLIMRGNTTRLDTKKLYKYWPIVLAPDSRTWITNKLKTGYASGNVVLNIDDQMYEANKFPPASVQSTVDARDITAEYLPGFPELKHVNGVAHFVGDSMHIDATAGSLLGGTKIISGTLTSANLHAPGAPMQAIVKLTTTASDIATLLKLDNFTFDDSWKLDPVTIKGSADVTMSLGFNAFSDNPQDTVPHFDHMTYDIAAELKNIEQSGIMGHMNIHGLNGTVRTSNNLLKFDGRLGVSPTTGLNILLTQDSKGNTSADISGSIPRADFSVIGIPDRKQFGEGSLGIDAHVDLNKGAMRPTHATFDLTDLALDIPELSWSKKRGEKGSLSISPREEANSYALNLKARDLSIENAVLKTNEDSEITSLNLPHVLTDKNDFTLNYTTTADGYTVDLTGSKLDASTSYAQTDNSLLADFPPITLNIDLTQFTLVPDVPLQNVKGNLSCDKIHCNSANITAKTGTAMLKATINKVAGKRQFQLTSSDAGDLLKGLDITDRVYDGKLELTGKYDDSKQPAPFKGRLLISDFTLKNSQILGRIVSLASITGAADAITGNGMHFSKLGADIDHLQGIVNVRNGQATGNSLGITIEGKIDTTTTNLNLKGVLVPANLINSLFTKIPIIGALAGKEGEGLIAFNYKVDGKYSDPNVNVNPLSGLTPGFLRGIFGAGGSSNLPANTPDYPGDRPMPPAPTAKKKPSVSAPSEAAPDPVESKTSD